MSVGFYKMSPQLIHIGGRDEATWLQAYMQNDDVNDGCTKFYVMEENIAEAVKRAKTAERLAKKDKRHVIEFQFGYIIDLGEHKKITEELPAMLRKLLAEEEKRRDGDAWFDLEVLW